ncbi:unnamed protein product [Symbiodinium sp. CCMP2456]|nr:unnamed protein product [Symbiodinium sp. CCMP2456]
MSRTWACSYHRVGADNTLPRESKRASTGGTSPEGSRNASQRFRMCLKLADNLPVWSGLTSEWCKFDHNGDTLKRAERIRGWCWKATTVFCGVDVCRSTMLGVSLFEQRYTCRGTFTASMCKG